MEDYYNTSWARVVLYQIPFANAPWADNADSYDYNFFTRIRNLDRIPFNYFFKFDPAISMAMLLNLMPERRFISPEIGMPLKHSKTSRQRMAAVFRSDGDALRNPVCLLTK